MIIWLAIVILVMLIRGFVWLCGAIFGTNTPNTANPYAASGYPSYGAFDVLVYQASPWGGGTWTFCRRHGDYYSTLQDVQSLQAWGYQATFVQR